MTTKLRLLLISVASVLLLTATFLPAAAQQGPEDEDKQQVNISRDGKVQRATVLKEAPDPEQGRPSRPGGIIVNFRPGVSSAERERVHQQTGVDARERSSLRDADFVRVQPGREKEAMDAYRAKPEVLSVEPDLIARVVATPNDPNFSQQWGMTKINAPQAWNVTTGSTAVRVAVLDCGVYAPETSTFLAPDGLPGHPDLRNSKVVAWTNFTTSSSPDDFCNHGTHVAGIAAANTNNDIGVAGVGYNTKVVSVKVLGDNGSGSFDWIIQGILWAAGCPTDATLPCGTPRAEVINMSLGAATSCSVALQNAINSAWDQGLVIVAAAGNSNTSALFAPASCSNTVAVSASDQNDNRASFSNFGSYVDVAAPGVAILSTNYVGTYSSFDGTSMASPHVAGLAALVRATSYGTTNAAVVDRILTTANKSALAGSVNGRIDAAAAVGAPTPPAPAPAITSFTPTSGPVGTSVIISGTNFTGATPVKFNGTSATFAVNSDTQITATVPSAATTGPISVTTAGGTATSATNYSVTPAPPVTTCAAPLILTHSDTKPSGGGTVSFSWSAVSGATNYSVERQRTDGTWSVRATISATSFTGSDASNDPNWRVYVHTSNGSCTTPGTATVFNP